MIIAQARSFNRPVRLLLVNQLTINLGFYMLMPYLAGHLSGDLGLAAWLVGLILGVRNLSQQGMFLVGGTLADRLGHKPVILLGLCLRTVGFALLGCATSLPALLAASALTGLAGALFNPAVRAYLAQEAGERRIEAFAVFNVFYQTGILLGPLLGLLLGGAGFRVTCAVAAGVFALLTAAQAKALPARRGGRAGAAEGVLRDWRRALANRPFLLFSLAMTGSYVLNFQVYLGLPLEIRRITGGQGGVTVLFVLSGLTAVAGQVRLTAWARSRWTPGRAMSVGLALMGLAFAPPAFVSSLGAVLLSGVLLTVATMIVYPFEMDTIVGLGTERMVGTYYGLYNTFSGVGIALGNLGTGLALDAGRRAGAPWLPWTVLAGVGLACAAAVRGLSHRQKLPDRRQTICILSSGKWWSVIPE